MAPRRHDGSAAVFAPTAPAIAVGAAFLVVGVVQLLHSWPAIGDWAVAELIVRHVARHVPLSGPYSAERGYDHPLPWVYAIEWVPYRLFGSRSSAAPAMALWWNGAWASVIVWMLARRKATGLALLAVAALLTLALRESGAVLLLPWNPNLAVVPALALCFVAWRVALGERRLLPLHAGLAVWCVGAHLGFLPLVAVLLIVPWAALLVATLRTAEPRASARMLVRPVLLALATIGVLVLPALVDLVRNGAQSNPARIVRRMAPGTKRPRVATTDVVKVFRAELAIPPNWSRNVTPYNVLLYRPAAQIPLLLVVVAIVVGVAVRRRAWDEIVGIGLSFVALAGAAFGLWFVDDTSLKPWYLLPAQVAGAALVAFTLWSAARSIGAAIEARVDFARLRSSVGFRSAFLVAGALATLLAVGNMRTPYYHAPIAATTERLTVAVEHELPHGSPVVVDGPIDFDGYYSQSLTLQLDKAGYAVRVPDSDLFMYTNAFAIPTGWHATTLTLQITDGTPPAPGPGARLVTKVVIPARLAFAGRTLTLWQTPPT